MKLRYCLVILFSLLFSQSNTGARVILDKEIFYTELDGKMDLRFSYTFNKDSFNIKPKDKTSSYSYLRLFYLQRVYPNTQMGFNIKAEVSNISNLKALDIEKLNMEEWYFIIKNQGLGSIEYGKRNLVSQSMLINTSKIYVAAGGANGYWANYANLLGNEKKDDGAGYDKDEVFWVKPSIYSNYSGLKLKLKQPVVSYISPEIYNFQLGLSYVPGKSNLQYNNLVASGLSYKNGLSDDISFTTTLTGEFARGDLADCTNRNPSNLQCHNQLLHWNFGLKLKFFNLDCIFSYGNSGKSGKKLDSEVSSTYYMNAGVAYRSDSRKLSLTYFNGGQDIIGKGINKLTSYALSLEYPLFMGTSYYFDIVKFNTGKPKVMNNNSGYILLAGLKLIF
ncbi:porin [Wolbachia endosymbiont of Brugia pahangi]|uniref:porin n=1 Tax=Wolbachia endosymbiont of Brugia pahangi TaxID=96495 RepID=UPI001435D15A|nr:porin [Wolbachia endosymbiont of Brugia pahangi]QIT36400.1 gram-negative porin family protein [Wolbachia endosymbiont of Brugia pahangi]